MANPEHLRILKQGAKAWNQWRLRATEITPDLRGIHLIWADLHEADLSGVDLRRADLTGTDLSRTDLTAAHLSGADLYGAALYGTHLYKADLDGADLREANLREANLSEANLTGANLTGADFSKALLSETVFSDTDLTAVRGLETCNHRRPSTLDHRTLACSGPLPLAFLRGCGLPDALVDYLPSLLNEPSQFYSCFISYASKDQAFAERLHADLQNKGVRCWFAHADMKIGDRIRDTIDQQIRLREKLLIVLSATSIVSAWVEDEVEAALEEERTSQERRTVLFPIKIDHAVEETNQVWARQIKRTRHIGDFTHWKEHDAYQQAFNRLLRDLTAAAQ